MWFFGHQHTPLLMALHDGFAWQARHYHFHHGEWHAEHGTKVNSRNGKKIPKAILEFAVASNARRVRVLLSGELHILSMQLPEDAEKEELHTALVYETAEEMGVDAHMLRLASVSAGQFRMGADPTQVITAGFDLKMIEGFVHDCERFGLEFDAVGSLELAVLARHARMNEESRLLFLRRQTGLYAAPAFDTMPFLLTTVPFGCEGDPATTGQERMDRSAKRFEAHRDIPLRILVCERMPDTQRERVDALLGSACEVEWLPFSEMEEDVLRHAAWAEVGGAEAGCAMIDPPPKPRDPYRSGTYLCAAVILVTLLHVFLEWRTLHEDLERADSREAAWSSLLARREAARVERLTVEMQYDHVLARKELLTEGEALPSALLPLLNALAFDIPQHTRIESIQESPDGTFLVKGVTRWQDGLRRLAEAFGARGLTRDFSSEGIDTGGGQRFSFRVRKLGGGR